MIELTSVLSNLRGYVINTYGGMQARGTCFYETEDLIQVASEALLKLITDWPGIVAEMTDPPASRVEEERVFWGWLKYRIREMVGDYQNDFAHDLSMNGLVTDDGDDWAEEWLWAARTSLRPPDEGFDFRMLNDSIIGFYEALPDRYRIILALRYFDELTASRVAEVLDAVRSTVESHTRNARSLWRTHATTLYLEHPERPEPMIARPYEHPDSLVAYVRERHACDVDEFLARFVAAMRADVSYACDALARGMTIVPSSRAHQIRALTPAQMHQVDVAVAEGRTRMEIARDLGVEWHQVNNYLKRRHVAA